jgi:hypothetical protein
MLGGRLVDIADFPITLGSKTGWHDASEWQGRRRKANTPSTGQSTDIEIGASPNRGQRNPEHQALLNLFGTLVESSSVPGVAHS